MDAPLAVDWQRHIPDGIREKYSVYNHRHAAAILASEFPEEFKDLCNALSRFQLTEQEIRSPGGNETHIPRNFSGLLRPRWVETKLKAQLTVEESEGGEVRPPRVVNTDTHKIDYVRGKVALDLEWNSKDQTFDRDLFAFRTFWDNGRIDVAVLVTRDTELNRYFNYLGSVLDTSGNPVLKRNSVKPRRIIEKYGASTTHTGKLLGRLKAGRAGGCPVLVFGITSRCVANFDPGVLDLHNVSDAPPPESESESEDGE